MVIINNIQDLNKFKKSGGNIFSLDAEYRNLFFTDCDREDVLINLNKDIVKQLYLYGLNINQIDKKGETALFDSQSVDVAKQLIELGINKFRENNKGVNALYTVNDKEVEDYLYEQNLYRYNEDNIKTLYEKTLNINLLKEMIMDGLDVNMLDERGRNVLFHNNLPECAEKLQFLIDQGVDIYHSCKTYKNMFINYPPQLMEVLFLNGFSPDSEVYKDKSFLQEVNDSFLNVDAIDEYDYIIDKIKIYLKYNADYSTIKNKSPLLLKAISSFEKVKIQEIVESQTSGSISNKKRL